MEITDINKSIKRANSGSTFKFFETQYLDLDNEIYRYELTFSDKCVNPFKTIQGGMIASALDEVISISVNIYTQDKMLPSSTDIHVTFHRPLFVGKVIGTAKVIKLGKTIVSVEGKLYSLDGKLAASALHTAILTDTSKIK